MSDTSSNSGRHKRQASWRSNPLISKFNQKIDSLKEKIPRGRGSRQLDSELSLSEEVVIPTGKRVLSFAERSKDVLSALDEGYFSKEFDPLTWELAQLPSSVGQEELDVVVDKLASALEVVSAQLSNHVLKNHDRFVEGINTVASVEADLQSAHIVTCNARINLRFALDEVKTNMRIAKQTQQKQGYIGLLEHLLKLQQTQNLIKSHQGALESGDYAEAIMRCAECFDQLDSVGEVSVVQDLRKAVHDLYKETSNRMGLALRAICNDFRPDDYKRVLEGFMFDNITNQDLAEKILNAFNDALIINSTKVVRSIIVTKSNEAEKLLDVRGDQKFAEMCSSLPFDLLRPCLAKLLEILFDVLASYHRMSEWHKTMLSSLSAEASSEGPPERLDSVSEEAQNSLGTSRELDDATDMIDVLECVSDLLTRSRKVVWDVAARKVRDLLTGPAAFEGEHFLQVMEWCQRFLASGEAFVQEQSTFLRSIIGNQCGKFFETYHMTNLEALETLLNSEGFSDITSPIHNSNVHSSGAVSEGSMSKNMATMSLRDVLACSGIFENSAEDDFNASNFDSWLERGNPFRDDGSTKKRQHRGKQKFNVMLGFGGASNMGEDQASRRLDVDEHGISQGGNLWAGPSTESFPSIDSSRKGTADEDEEEDEAPELFGETIDEETQTVRWGESSAEQGQTSDANKVILTNSAQQILKWMKNYGSLMRPLSTRAGDIFEGMCWLFDSYILKVYLFVSDMSLEALIWEKDAMTTRLQSTLIRIMTQDGSPYRDDIIRIQSMKPISKSVPQNPKESKFTKDFKSFFSKERGGSGGPGVSGVSTAGAAGPSPTVAPLAVNGTSSASMEGALRKSHKIIGQEYANAKSTGNMYGLKETVVAIASAESLAKQLADSRSILQTLLPQEASRSLDDYYRTVDAVADLKEVAYRNSARRMLHEVLDPEKGVAQQIVMTKYDGEEISHTHNSWAHVLGDHLGNFSEFLGYASLPERAVFQMWENAIKVAGEVILDGFSRVEMCSMGGRSMMSLDLTYVENLFKCLVPDSVPVNLRVVDTYIKAYYLPWEELPTWAQLHLVEYGQPKISGLVEHIAQRIKALDEKELKRSEIRAMKNDIEKKSTELGL